MLSWSYAIRHTSHLIFGAHNFVDQKFLTRLRLGLSHLHEHNFHHEFRDAFAPVLLSLKQQLTICCLAIFTLPTEKCSLTHCMILTKSLQTNTTD